MFLSGGACTQGCMQHPVHVAQEVCCWCVHDTAAVHGVGSVSVVKVTPVWCCSWCAASCRDSVCACWWPHLSLYRRVSQQASILILAAHAAYSTQLLHLEFPLRVHWHGCSCKCQHLVHAAAVVCGSSEWRAVSQAVCCAAVHFLVATGYPCVVLCCSQQGGVGFEVAACMHWHRGL